MADDKLPWSDLKRNLVEGKIIEANKARANSESQFRPRFEVLNHYYSAWSRVSSHSGLNDRKKLRHFATYPPLKDQWSKFRTFSGVKGKAIELPLEDQNGNNVPRDLDPGKYTAEQLSLEQWLEVIYQIRCSVFHGDGEHDEFQLNFAAGPLGVLADFLVKNTG